MIIVALLLAIAFLIIVIAAVWAFIKIIKEILHN